MARPERSPETDRRPPGYHRLAVFLATAIVGLIAAGALVKSKEAGLAVPDWPLSYGSLNPPRWWEIENVRAEHGHRLIAGTIALITAGLAVWVGRRERRLWVRRLAYGALGAVLVQALLGGLTVLFFLPPPISVGHAALAQIFLCIVVALALVTSRWWRDARPSGGRTIARWATVVSALIYLQILIGAVMRHAGAGLAIPDFPLVFGGLVPPTFDFAIGIHYAHRVGALVVTVAVLATALRVLRDAGRSAVQRWPAIGMLLVLAAQVGLGAAVILTRKAVLVNTAHVATGATLLALSLILTLSSWRLARLPEPLRQEVGLRAGRGSALDGVPS